MNKRLSLLALTALSLSAQAAPRSAAQALAVAKQFVANNVSFQGIRNAQLTLSPSIAAKANVRGVQANLNASAQGNLNASAQAIPYYIINVEGNNGYVIVSGDDRFVPILGYSATGNLGDADDIPAPVQYWLGMLSGEMEAAIAAGYEAPKEGRAKADAYSESIEPLITAMWDQTQPYNNLIPNYATGCVATGTAMIMKYWNYPEHGIGSHTHASNSTHSANFGATTYDWANMKDQYGGKYDTPEQVNAVATLMYHLGIATDMRWDTPAKGSGTPNMYAGNALVNYFGYNKNLHAESRDCYSLGAWKAILIDQLRTGHPLAYAGMGKDSKAGHFFVLDGYDANTGLFHFNWGWSGKFNAYYSITALEPGTGGTGAGAGVYNYDQMTFIDLQPETVGEYVAHFDAKEVSPASESAKKSQVELNVTSVSHNSINFAGTLGMAIYSADGTYLQYVKADNPDLPAGFNPGTIYTATHKLTLNLSALADGTYIICAASQHNDHTDTAYPVRAYYGKPTYYTMVVAADNVTLTPNVEDFYITDPEAPALLGSADNTVYQNKLASFSLSVKNTGTSEFCDEVGVCIKKSRDANPQYITVPCTLAPGEAKTLTVKGIVTRDPGSYTLLACYGVNGEYITLDNSIDLTVGNEAEGISAAKADDPNAPLYTLTGVRVANANVKGIYIQNGKKVIIK